MTTGSPRLVIAGAAGDSGKTILSLGTLLALRQQGLQPAAFKKGPDYIDAAWLGWAAGSTCRNLDTFLQPESALLDGFAAHASRDLSLVEGNRGLLDGMDAAGTHSTASLARLLRAPVVLVVNVTKVTRTVAALVLGCKQLEPDLKLGGVVLNRVAGPRHEQVVRQAVEQLCGVPVLGAIRRQRRQLLPDRHLGLVPPEEHGQQEQAAQELCRLVRDSVDLERMLQLGREAPALPQPAGLVVRAQESVGVPRARIGVFRDSAFTFYYPENLEALERAGAELVPISGLSDARLPDVGALYLGGGFPETHGPQLSHNVSLRREVRAAAEAGMPIYAECGGLIYLSRSLRTSEGTFAMAGVLPLDLELSRKPVGHGYVELTVDGDNPYFPRGSRLRGHEFHYSGVTEADWQSISSVFEVKRGVGVGRARDGISYKRVLAAYTHLHALGVQSWAPALVDQAQAFGRWAGATEQTSN